MHFLVGRLIWLTGHYSCTTHPQSEDRQTFQHDGENVAQKYMDIPSHSVGGFRAWQQGGSGFRTGGTPVDSPSRKPQVGIRLLARFGGRHDVVTPSLASYPPRPNLAGWLALAAPIFSILAVAYLVVIFVWNEQTPRSCGGIRQASVYPHPQCRMLYLTRPLPPSRWICTGKILEMYIALFDENLLFSKTYVAIKVQIVNHGPDEATVISCGLQNISRNMASSWGDYEQNS